MKSTSATQGPQGCLFLLMIREAFGMNFRDSMNSRTSSSEAGYNVTPVLTEKMESGC